MTFRPSLVANIRLMFDEALHVQELSAPRSVDQQVDQNSQAPMRPRLEPLVTRRGNENASFIMNRVPKSASVVLPAYRQAGTFEIEIDFVELPIDPRTVRSAAVEIYLGTVSDDDFAAGMRGREADGSRRSILRTHTSAGQPDTEALLILGMVDEWSMSHTAKGGLVRMKGRDMRGVLLDTPIGIVPNAERQLLESLDLSQPIDAVVVQILDFNPLFQNISVEVNPGEWPDGVVPAPYAPDLVPRHRRGARGSRSSGRGTPSGGNSSLNFWDLIVRFCYLVGAIPYFVGNVLRIRPSRSIYDQARNGFFPDQPTPFANGDFRDRDPVTGALISPALNFRRIVFGRDTDELSFDRKYSGFHRPRVVRAVSIDASSTSRGPQRVVVGVWPPRDDSPPNQRARRTRTNPSAQHSQEEILNIPVSGISDVNRLQEIARSVYEEIGRGEMGGSCQTKSLASFGGTNADPDLLRLRPGDGVEILVDTRARSSGAPLASSFTDAYRNSFEEQVAQIRQRLGGDENLARAIVATSRGQIAEVQRFFRVSNVSFNWGSDKGVDIKFDFQNYVTVRNQVSADPVSEGGQIRRTSSGTVVELNEVTIEGSLDDANVAGRPAGGSGNGG